MIVRNEAPILERCIESVRGLIDAWVVCDTGSTDETREVVREQLDGIPGALHDIPWTDFGSARSELMTHARGAADYLLLIDADMTIRQTGALPQLRADAYLLRESGALDYGVARLVRGDRDWWYVGSTHEYIATNGHFRQDELDVLVVDHHADGASRPHKLKRDIGLLKRDLARDPDNARAVFYLAQSFRELGEHDRAIEYYRRRVDMRGWDEEVFYANLQEGILKAEKQSDWGVPTLLEAWQRRPTRAEPLYELARLYRGRREGALAHLFAERGLQIPYPDDTLFIHRWVYEWGLLLERALASVELGRPDEATADLEQLASTPDLPAHVQDFVQRALDSAPGLSGNGPPPGANPPRLAAIAPSTRIGEIKIDVKPAWPCFNPSIAADGDGFRMIVRTANYQIERGVLHADGILLNVNYLLELDRDLRVTAIEPIADRSRGLRRFPSQVQGYEDCRLIEHDGRWYASATVCDLNAAERREIALLELDGADIVSVTRLPGPERGRHEKNWMPFVHGGALSFLYTSGPTVVLEWDGATRSLAEVSRRNGPPGADEYRGSSQGVPIDDGYLFVVHEVTRHGPKLQYVHRFVQVDDALGIVATSVPFTFISDRVEFCAGLARREDELVLSFGISDAAAGLAVVELADVLALLRPAGHVDALEQASSDRSLDSVTSVETA